MSVHAIISSVVESDSKIIHFNDGAIGWVDHDSKLHRLDGPAMIGPHGHSEVWYHHGQRHRVGGPAVEYKNGNRIWYQFDKLHNIDGPAVITDYSHKEWWVNGRRFTEEEFNLYVDQLSGEVLIPPGKKLRHDC